MLQWQCGSGKASHSVTWTHTECSEAGYLGKVISVREYHLGKCKVEKREGGNVRNTLWCREEQVRHWTATLLTSQTWRKAVSHGVLQTLWKNVSLSYLINKCSCQNIKTGHLRWRLTWFFSGRGYGRVLQMKAGCLHFKYYNQKPWWTQKMGAHVWPPYLRNKKAQGTFSVPSK